MLAVAFCIDWFEAVSAFCAVFLDLEFCLCIVATQEKEIRWDTSEFVWSYCVLFLFPDFVYCERAQSGKL